LLDIDVFEMMKFFSFILSTIVLIQSFNVHFSDLIQISELVEHAEFHKNEYGDNFMKFMVKHYGDLKADHNKKHQEEENEHEELPFQHEAHSISISDFTFNIYETPLKGEDFLTSKKSIFYYNLNYTSLEGSGIFQPPKHS